MAGDKLKWLKPWLQLPFYKEKCTYPNHEKHYMTIFCTNCMKPPVCKFCWDKKSSQHKDHQVLKVCSTTRRPSISIREINKYVNISGIQTYLNNSDQVVYLNRHVKENETSTPPIHKKACHCQVCNGRLIDSKFTFCSIACKISTMEMELDVKSDLGRVNESDANENMQLITVVKKSDEERLPDEIVSFRKRSRKGTPIRAPPF